MHMLIRVQDYKPQLLFNTSLLSKYMYTANICVSVFHDVDVK